MKEEFDELKRRMDEIRLEVAMMSGSDREVERLTGFPNSTISHWRRTIRKLQRSAA